jgi:hypothetical protein
MTRFALGLALASLCLAFPACSPAPAPATETDASTCSNGIDDDHDGMTDCRDLACSVFAFCAAMDAGNDASLVDANEDAGPPADGATCGQPLDIVFTIDVSTSMAGELAAVRDGVPSIWSTAHALSSNVQFSLVVFVDDALAVNACAPFATAEDLVASLEEWRMTCASNQSPVSHIQNTDCPENSIDAMMLAATTCPFRDGSTRILVHVTDDTFAERPAVLSGEWTRGVFVEHTYAELAEELHADQIRVGAFAIPGPGESCGAGISPDVGRGFHTPYMDMEALPSATGGRVWDLRDVRAGTLSMADAINEMVRAEYCTSF